MLTCTNQITFPLPFLSCSSGYIHSHQTTPLLVASASVSETGTLGTVMKFVGNALCMDNVYSSAPYFTLELVPNLVEKETVSFIFYNV